MDAIRRLTVCVVVAGLACLSACGGSDDDDATTTTTADTEASETTEAETTEDAPSSDASDPPEADGEFVTGDPDEWLASVCGPDAEVQEDTSTASIDARYGEDATQVFWCTPPDGTDTYPEVALFDADPSADWQPATDGERYLTFAIGQVSDEQWAVLYEDSSTMEIAEPHLAGLVDFGFVVYENNEPVG